ncbi:MAG: argininosuccinate synthase [Bacteroidales bacterium]|nr:argininosuccinate synthase [Bacteroidales bacterium]MBN2697611.1 argininosuccinate synthase [Bacteroidales bacterium]
MNGEKVLLALSGGLDTSFCAVYLARERQMEVHSAVVNTGGFGEEELSAIAQQAARLGTASHETLDITGEYYRQCLRFMIFGNVLRNRSYPLSVSSERTFQAIALVKYAREKGFGKLAHGSTAAGNDQVRFDLVIGVLAPEMEIITPVRELQISREEEIAYLQKQGIIMSAEKAKYSINKGLWGTSVGGKETLTSGLELPGEAYPVRVTKKGSVKLTLGFEQGEPVSINGKSGDPVEVIRKLEEIAAPWGTGRDVHVGDTIIGIKGRVGFEAAAARVIIDAHLALEKHVLTRWQLHWKEQVGNWYGMFVHEAQYLEPVMRDLEEFLVSSQKNVTGEVTIRLRPYSHSIIGVNSRYDLMRPEFASYGEMNRLWSAGDVNGFTKILGNQQKIWYRVNEKGAD